jgi:hypothetical protein
MTHTFGKVEVGVCWQRLERYHGWISLRSIESEQDMSPARYGFRPERINVDYRLWLRQKTELAMLRFLVTVQLLGILVLAIAVGYLMFSWY